MTFGNIFLIFLLIALNGFFVAVEFAAVSSRRSRLDLMSRPDSHASKLVHGWLESGAARDRLIAASQLGITVVSLALGAVGENSFEAWLDPLFKEAALPAWLAFLEAIFPALPLVFSLIIVTSLHVVLGEQVPKVAVLRSPERFALFSAPLMDVFGRIFKFFVDILDWATRLVLSLLGIRASSSHTSSYSLAEIKEMVSGPEIEGIIEQPEREMLSAVIDFGELVVRQVTVPRTEIIAVEADAPMDEVLQIATQSLFTKLPVYEDSLDQVIGVIHLHDLLRFTQNPDKNNSIARDIMREALFVPETVSVNQLLKEFRTRRQHMAIVLDEFGGTSGLVTLEDLLDEIIGEFSSSLESGLPSIQHLADGSSLIDGMTFIEEINEHFGLRLQDPNYDTIAGFILGRLGRIAQMGDVVEDKENGVRLKVMKMDRLRIAQVSLILLLPSIPQGALDDL